MKKSLLLVMLVMSAVIISYPNNAGAWGNPSLEYSPEELDRAAETICLASLARATKHNYHVTVGMKARARYGKLWWDVKKGKASLIIETIDYHLGSFGERKRTGIMGWPFRVYCKSRATTYSAQGEEVEFSKQSDIGCFILIRDDGKQLFGLPGNLNSFANWENWEE